MKIITMEEAVNLIQDGQCLMVGGFGLAGEPRPLLHALAESDVKDLDIISNSSGGENKGVGRLVYAHKVKRLQCSHIGGCKETQRQAMAGEIEVDLMPQGTFIERIRCGGMGLGGFLTETGVGTEVAKGKEVKVIDGVEYLLETPLHAEIALICGTKADRFGNIYYHGASKNFNIAMATAADKVIALVNEVVDEIQPELVGTPGFMVDYVVVK